MAKHQSYFVCGTPRTGSTLLCTLLASTGVAGRPESYFREPDQRTWAEQLGVTISDSGAFDYRRFVAGAVAAGSTPNGVFAGRIMWGTLPLLIDGLRSDHRGDLQVLQDTFGPVRFVHLQRRDVVSQAVSWARAEQTGYWQHGDSLSTQPRFDAEQIDHLLTVIRDHNEAWREWFAEQGVEPIDLTYEDLVTDPTQAMRRIHTAIGIDLPDEWRPSSSHQRQADETNADWVRRYRALQS